MRFFPASLILIATLSINGCGYHQAGSATHLPPSVRTLAVPIFTTRSQAFHTEAAFTQAIVRELNTRTHYRILPDSSPEADATLTGTILAQSVAPLTYDSSSGQTSSYLITVTARVILTARDGTVLYRNDSLAYREQYQSTQDLTLFVQEDSAAVPAHRPRLRPGSRQRHVGELPVSTLRSFASTERFLTEIATACKPGYVLLGDEAYLQQRCRAGVLAILAPLDTRGVLSP